MKNFLEQKKIKYATFSAVMTGLVIAVILLINILSQGLDISFDMTTNKENSLSNETISYLDELDEDVTIYALYKTGEVYKPFEEIFSEYEKNSDHITVEYIDPYQNPQFVDKYKTDDEEIPVGSLIVEGEDKFKVVSSQGLIEQGSTVTVNNLEPRLTNAIIYVNDENTPVIYTVTGHNEVAVGESTIDALSESNFDVKTLNLLSEDIPEDCSALILTTPQNDYSVDEVNKVIKYLDNGGSAFMTTDLLIGADKVNYNSIMQNYGVQAGDYIAMEGDNDKYIENLPLNIIPTIEDTDVTKNLLEKGKLLLLPTTTGIEETSSKSSSTTITPILTTSSKSYGKANAQTATFAYEKGDQYGPFNLSVLVEDSHSLSTDEVTKLIVTGTSGIVDESINSYIGGGNSDYVVACMKYLSGEKEDVYLSPKVVQSNTLTMTFQNVVFVLIYSVILVPLIILIIGTVVFFRRKNR